MMNPQDSQPKLTLPLERDSLLDEMLDQTAVESTPSHDQADDRVAGTTPKYASGGLLIGRIVSVAAGEHPQVVVPEIQEQPTPVASLVPQSELKIGVQCALMPTPDGNGLILMGVLQQNLVHVPEGTAITIDSQAKSIDIVSESEINLRCGDAHLRMTSDGLVELRGNKVVSHSSGLNRIRGASVKLN